MAECRINTFDISMPDLKILSATIQSAPLNLGNSAPAGAVDIRTVIDEPEVESPDRLEFVFHLPSLLHDKFYVTLGATRRVSRCKLSTSLLCTRTTPEPKSHSIPRVQQRFYVALGLLVPP